MNQLTKLRCESCGATLNLSEDKKIASCEYCGSEFLVKNPDVPKENENNINKAKGTVDKKTEVNNHEQIDLVIAASQSIQTVAPIPKTTIKNAWPRTAFILILMIVVFATCILSSPEMKMLAKSIFAISNIAVAIMLLKNTVEMNKQYKQMAVRPKQQITPLNRWSSYFVWFVYVVGFICSVIVAQDEITLTLVVCMAGFGGILILPSLIHTLIKK